MPRNVQSRWCSGSHVSVIITAAVSFYIYLINL
jgi:hypothetical protein